MIANKADAMVVVEEQAQTIKDLRAEVVRLTEIRIERLTSVHLDNLEQAARTSFGTDERSQVLKTGMLALIAEVRDLRKQVAQLAEALEVAIE